MKTHTSQFKEDIKTVGKQLDSKITFKVNGVTQTLTSEDLNGVTPTFQGAILKSVMKELDIDSNVNIPIGTEVNYQFGVKLENDFEYLDYGNYIVYSSEKQEDTSSYKIICYDKMLYSMKQNEDLGITYPISIRNYINALCTKIGLEFKNKNDEFANFDRVLDKELYVGLDYTYRDILDELAQVTASTICLDNEDKVEIRYINDLTELNEVVGTNININDSIDYKLNSLTLYGKSTQATTQGKQLFNYEDTTMVTDGITVDEDGWITATFDNTNGTGYKYLNFYTNNLNLKNSTTYAIVSEIKSVSGTGFLIPVSKTNTTPQTGGQFNSEVSYNFATLTNNMIKIETPTTIDDFSTTNYGLRTLLQFAKGQSGSITFRLSVLEDTSVTADTFVYEKFTGGQPSPSPDFPSPIESIGRKNLFDESQLLQATNWQNNNGIYSGIIDNWYSKFKTGFTGLTFEANTQYTISFKGYTTGGTPRLKIVYGDSTSEQINITASSMTLYTKTTALGKTVSSIQADFGTGSSNTLYLTEFQLEKSTVVTDYVPYEHTEISVKVTGKNLINPNLPVNSKTQNGITITNNGDGTYTATGTSTSSLAISLTQPNTIKLNKNTSYTNSIEILEGNFLGTIAVTVLDSEDKITYNYINVSSSSLSNTKIPTEDLTIKAYEYYISKANITVNFKFRVQLEEETQVTPFEEYKSNSLTIDLQGNELCGLPNGTKDEVNITNGEALLIKRVGKVVLDGSESWSITTPTHDGFTRYSVSAPAIKGQNLAISSHFIVGDTTSTSVTNLLEYRNTNYIFINTDIASALEDFKTWLSTHNTEVYYVLAEPETINLGTVEMPHTYNGVSNITNSADTEMIVKYAKGWETINEEYLKDINVNFGQKYGPVNSVVLTRGAESDNIYLQDENSIAQNGLCEIKIADNQIMNWNDRSDYLPDILEKLDGLEYYLNDFSSTGIAYLDLCDRYNVEVFGNTYSCVMFNDELLVTQGLEENVHTDMPEETETDYTKADKTDRKINNVSLIVDKQEQKINALAEKIQDISNTISGTGVITLTECNQTPLYKLVITGDDSLLFSNNKLFPSATTYLKSSTLYVNKGTDYEAIYDLKIPALRTLGSVKDEYIMENGKAKLIKRIGLNNNLQKYVLDTPIETDLGEMIINLKEGENTLEIPSFPAFYCIATYLLQNEYTDVFASQAQVTSQINIANDEVLIESKSQILGNGDELIASINTTSTGNVKIKASDTIALEGTTTVGDKIMFNLDGSITAQDLRLLDGGKVIGGDGLLTSMQFESVGQYNGFQFLGFNYNANNEVYKTSVSTTFNIPENFVVVSAYATLLHTPINFWDFNNTSITGSAKNLKLYKDFSANVDKIYAGFNSGYWIENNNLNGDEITNAFGSATYTPANSQSGILVSKTSIDIKDYISTGLNTLFVRTTDSTSSTSSNSTDACKKTGCAKLIIQVIGYTNFK